MTYKQFAAILAAKRPDVVAAQHRGYDGRADTVGIYFVTPDGQTSRVYNYRGTYAQVLARLGIIVITRNEVRMQQAEIDRLYKTNGEINIFSGISIDNTSKIKAAEDKFFIMMSSPDIVREWEW